MILSFDIGIKNLGYCFLDKECNIKAWDIINLTKEETEPEQKQCSGVFKSGKNKGEICYKKAFYFDDILDSETKIYLCKSHKPKDHANKLLNEKTTFKKVKDIKIIDLGIKLTEAMDSKINSLMIEFKPEYILLELQPRFNPKMKNLSIMLFNYFILRYICDYKEGRFIKDIKFINAKRKLTVYNGPFIPCNLKDKYARTKYLGVKYCEYMIKEQEDYLDFFKNKTKKDDLSDCYMQGVWFIKNNKRK